VALAAPLNIHLGFRNSGSQATYEDINDHIADGAVVPATGTTTGELLYDADIEPDADHDGFGDITQDSCASDGSTQGACAQVIVDPGAKPKPEISHFKATPKQFRVKRGGAVLSQRSAHAGTTLKLTLSEAASVAFSMRASVACKGKHCPKPRPAAVQLPKLALSKGKNSIPFSGLYKSGKKVRALKPGSYTLTAVATNDAGRASAPSQTKLIVIAP
jgi:hypothetical protein